MKIISETGPIILATGIFGFNTWAQTPFWTNSATGEIYTNYITDKTGYVTNADYLVPFSMTNSDGQLLTNAVLVKLTANKFIYKTPDGTEGTARMDSLSRELQKRFRYDPQRATNADNLDSLQKISWELQKAVAQENDKEAALQAKVSKYRQYIYGDVVQKIEAGILVNSPGSVDRMADSHMILIKHYPNEGGLAADDQVTCWAYPLGIYSYTTVNGSENSVHVYTCDFQEALNYYSGPSQ